MGSVCSSSSLLYIWKVLIVVTIVVIVSTSNHHHHHRSVYTLALRIVVPPCCRHCYVIHPQSSTHTSSIESLLSGRWYRSHTSSILLKSHTLTTALECLSTERKIVQPTYENIRWIDLNNNDESTITPTTTTTTSGDFDQRKTMTMLYESSDDDSIVVVDDPTIEVLPLYPLPTVYLPVEAINHTLNNVERQNIQMAKDLMMMTMITTEEPSNQSQELTIDFTTTTTTTKTDGWMGGRRFCAVLRAIDTGRIATVGTILRIVDAEVQTYYGNANDIARIRLTCQTEGLVQIVQIVNPDAFSQERRLRRSDEYLRAHVRPVVIINNNDDNTTTGGDTSSLAVFLRRILGNVRLVKTMYQLELGAEDFPPGMLSQLGDAIDVHSLALKLDEAENDIKKLDSFVWTLSQEWQSICMTLRQGQQSILSTDRNERMIDAATAKGGPLKLPIHLEDLEPEARRDIQLLEVEAQSKHVQMGMDALLDFQVLVSIPSIEDRIKWLDLLIARERTRLEGIASNR